MAIKPKRPCSFTGCPNLISGKSSYCPNHKDIPRINYDKNRETATKRGYDTRWKKAGPPFLADNPLCAECLKQDRVTPANTRDHIIPCKPDDPRFWDQSNWQALCQSCHSIKSATEDGGFGRKSVKKVETNANRQPVVRAGF